MVAWLSIRFDGSMAGIFVCLTGCRGVRLTGREGDPSKLSAATVSSYLHPVEFV